MKRALMAAVALLITVGLAGTAGAATVISEGFDGFDTGTRPSGWTFTGCDQNSDTYTTAGNYGLASPSIRLDATADQIVTETFSNPSAAGLDLSFWLRGLSTNLSSNLAVEAYYSGGWNSVTDIYGPDTSGATYGPLSINASSTQVRFTYTKDAGNIAFDDVLIETGATTTTTTVTTTTTTTAGTTTTAATIEHYVIDWDDYDGDGVTDAALFDDGTWQIQNVGTSSYGSAGDIPVSGDYNGDGTAERAYFTSGGLWYVDGVYSGLAWGAGGQIPVPADYDGDGTTDPATYSPGSGNWYIYPGTTVQYGGRDGDIPVPGDYDGDGTADRALYRWVAVEQGKWYVDGVGIFSWGGSSTDIPVPMDYDGDGVTDPTFVRNINDTHFIWKTINGDLESWGIPTVDTPLTGDFSGDGADEAVIWRAHRTRWFAKSGAYKYRVNFGGSDGIPAIGACY